MNHLFDVLCGGTASPDARFIETPDGRVFSYGAILRRAAAFAAVLAATGAEPGDRVAVQVEKSIDALALYLACVRSGTVLVPLNTAYTLAELGYFLSDAEPRAVVCPPEREVAVAAIAGKAATVLTLGGEGEGTLPLRAAAAGDAGPVAPRGAEDLAAIVYTSGTTGRSKGAMLTHANLASNALTLVAAWRFTRGDVLIHALPIFHVHGLFVAINTVMAAGGAMLFLRRFDAGEILALLPRATAMMGVPTFYTRLLQQPGLTRAATAAIRVFISGSAPLLPETFAVWRERTGHAILERYGMTETGMNTSNPYDGERVAGTVGPPLAGIAARVTEPESGRSLPAGEIGMIEVRGPNVFKGYWRMPEKTAAEFRADGFFITGDLGRIDAAGYVHILGRGKDLVITGGYNVYPKEVETEIDRLPGVVESAVIGLPHPDLGEGVTAVVIAAPQAAVDEAAVIAALSGRLARFKQPKRVLFLPELPRNAMGKVQKNLLRDRFRDLYTAGG
jgi:malonyl-CoA/methylmalonyl-CoA synthetase